MELRSLLSVCYQGCWRLLSLLRSHCGRKSHNPDPGDPPAPVYWPAGLMSQLHREEKNSYILCADMSDCLSLLIPRSLSSSL